MAVSVCPRSKTNNLLSWYDSRLEIVMAWDVRTMTEAFRTVAFRFDLVPFSDGFHPGIV